MSTSATRTGGDGGAMTPEEALEKHPDWRKFDEVLQGVGYEHRNAICFSYQTDRLNYTRCPRPITDDMEDVILWADGEHWVIDRNGDYHEFATVLDMLTTLRKAHGA